MFVNELEGDVVQIRLRSTVINTLTNETIIVPNRLLVDNYIHNYSYRDKRIVIINRVQVAYSTDLEKAVEVLLEAAGSSPYALSKPLPKARVMEFQDSGILMELWTWIGDMNLKRDATAQLNMEIWRKFKDAGITIPFPQRDVHIKEAASPDL